MGFQNCPQPVFGTGLIADHPTAEQNQLAPFADIKARHINRWNLVQKQQLSSLSDLGSFFRFGSAPSATFWKTIYQPETTRSKAGFSLSAPMRDSYRQDFGPIFPYHPAGLPLPPVPSRHGPGPALPAACTPRPASRATPRAERIPRAKPEGRPPRRHPPARPAPAGHPHPGELFNQCTRPVIAHTATLAGVGVQLGSIHTDHSHLKQLQFTGQSHNLQKAFANAHPFLRRNLQMVS